MRFPQGYLAPCFSVFKRSVLSQTRCSAVRIENKNLSQKELYKCE